MNIKITDDQISEGLRDGWNDPISIALAEQLKGRFTPFVSLDSVLICENGRDLDQVVCEIPHTHTVAQWMDAFDANQAESCALSFEIPAEFLARG